jgi:hypothetical protein
MCLGAPVAEVVLVALGDPGPVTESERRLHANNSAMLAAKPPYSVARATRRVVVLMALILRSS